MNQACFISCTWILLILICVKAEKVYLIFHTLFLHLQLSFWYEWYCVIYYVYLICVFLHIRFYECYFKIWQESLFPFFKKTKTKKKNKSWYCKPKSKMMHCLLHIIYLQINAVMLFFFFFNKITLMFSVKSEAFYIFRSFIKVEKVPNSVYVLWIKGTIFFSAKNCWEMKSADIMTASRIPPSTVNTLGNKVAVRYNHTSVWSPGYVMCHAFDN